MVENGLSILEKQAELVEEFDMLQDWTEKYEHIIAIGKSMPELNPTFKIDDNLIKGCQSKVWLHAFNEDGKISFEADSDAIITKGLVGMIIRVFSGHSPQEILDTELTFIDKIGLKQHLSPTRSNGLLSMVKQLKFYALAYSAKQ
jgi:cysteine desulfuration protein SufE